MNNHILIIDNDEDEQFLIRSSFEIAGDAGSLCFADGPAGIADYLKENGRLPRIIIVDPKALDRDATAFIHELKTSSVLSTVPVIVYSSHTSPEDVKKYYQAGANSFIEKPATFAGMVNIAEVITAYWLNTAALPKHVTVSYQ